MPVSRCDGQIVAHPVPRHEEERGRKEGRRRPGLLLLLVVLFLFVPVIPQQQIIRGYFPISREQLQGFRKEKVRKRESFSRDHNAATEDSPPPTQDPSWAQKLQASLSQKPPKTNLPILQWILHSHKVQIAVPQPSEPWTLTMQSSPATTAIALTSAGSNTHGNRGHPQPPCNL